ncbi:pfs domain-containing protein [Penicillium alfredii]|uniref:Pfs domain-containing protein n=1 Tax=Penicillium alfredii TaxID=1506179 RepID=A0A9W9EH26_9EURO|nr:pfs domain-containing protein [Penicillium alfredii]KAJ5081639.1 pfs domain-containing protein [Penicillium alfredii]
MASLVRHLCCFGSPSSKSTNSREEAVALEKKPGNSRQSSETEFDLYIDEGINLQEKLWQAAVSDKSQCIAISQRQSLGTFTTASYESSLQSLRGKCRSNSLSRYQPHVERVLGGIKPFVGALNTMVSSHPEVAGLVWGATQIVLEGALRYTSIFEEISRIIEDLAQVLPRFGAFLDILRTPKLHTALREVYCIYIDFCSVETKRLLSRSKVTFEDEVQLAIVQVEAARHQELLLRLPHGKEDPDEPVTQGLLAQNPRFTGRKAILERIHSRLDHSGETSPEDCRMRSCTVHGIGGIGKTETALEYTYRYRSYYTHIFWFRADSSSDLLDSFLKMVTTLGLGKEDMSSEKLVAEGLRWLSNTTARYLLIYDNAEEPRTILPFWPSGVHGTVLVTSQNPGLSDITSSAVELTSMTPGEGSLLIQSYLQRGRSEQAEARALCEELGGLPLAIAHFAGYVAKSQCSLQQISSSLQERLKSSQIWSSDSVASRDMHARTLSTVWDLAMHRLTPDAYELLRLLAFLSPDSVPEEMFIGPGQEETTEEWDYWSVHKYCLPSCPRSDSVANGIVRFNEAAKVLRERHLVDRLRMNDGSAAIKIHRALQRSILHKLDQDPTLRQHVFDTAVSIVRRAFPLQSLAKKGDTSQWPANKKFLPHVNSLNTCVTQADPPMGHNLTLAELERDASWFLLNWEVRPTAIPLLEGAERICRGMIATENPKIASIYADVLCTMASYDQYDGIEGRERGLERTGMAWEIREREFLDKPTEDVQPEDYINLGRTLGDYGCCYAQMDRIHEANECWEKMLGFYKKAGTEKTLTARFGQVYGDLAMARAAQGRHEEAKAYARNSLRLLEQALDPENHFRVFTTFILAFSTFAAGDIEDALQLHRDALSRNLEDLGPSHHLTLASRYNVAVGLHRVGDLEGAECVLFPKRSRQGSS